APEGRAATPAQAADDAEPTQVIPRLAGGDRPAPEKKAEQAAGSTAPTSPASSGTSSTPAPAAPSGPAAPSAPASPAASTPSVSASALPSLPVVRRNGYDREATDKLLRTLHAEKAGLAASIAEAQNRLAAQNDEIAQLKT